MTKSIKKIFAALLVVATLALMIPFSASAARNASTEVTFKLDDTSVVGKFKFDFYKLASVDTSNGKVTADATLPATVKAEIAKEGTDANTTALITACKANLANLPASVWTWNATTASVTKSDLAAGIYYVHPVALGTATKANDSIVVLPKYDATTKQWVKSDDINLAEKISTKDIVLDKTITKVDNTDVNAKYATAGLGSTVEFKLEANVPGSETAKLKKYAIADEMDNGLTINKNSVKVYYTDGTKLDNSTLVDSSKYTVDEPFTAKGKTYTFAVNFNAGADGYVNDIYDAGKKMVVVFDATVNKNATVGKTSNNNQVSLNYANDDTELTEVGSTVQVYAFNIQVVKTNKGGTTKLAGAEFDLLKADKTTKIATATSDANGLVQFTNGDTQIQLAAGKYYVKETKAPEGYVLPTGDAAITEINIVPTIELDSTVSANGPRYKLTALDNSGDNAQAIVTKEIENIKLTVPKTGGMGTAIFTICGASLIALAGVMFVVLKKKKTTK